MVQSIKITARLLKVYEECARSVGLELPVKNVHCQNSEFLYVTAAKILRILISDESNIHRRVTTGIKQFRLTEYYNVSQHVNWISLVIIIYMFTNDKMTGQTDA